MIVFQLENNTFCNVRVDALEWLTIATADEWLRAIVRVEHIVRSTRTA